MATFQSDQVRSWIGYTVVDSAGDKVGKIEDVDEDDQGSGPEWFAISTGLFGGKHSFAPVHGSTVEGDQVRLSWTKDVVKDAPTIDDNGHIDEADEDRLYQHYNMDWSSKTDVDRSTTTTTTAQPAAKTTTDVSTARTGDDDAMTRSEEELNVTTRQREAGRARIKKWVETEQVQVTVPVRKEYARMVTEPITDANRDAALDGPEITEGEFDVVLHEEEVIVDKKVVPKERVRLETEVVQDEKVVSDTVRKERIGMDGGTETTTTSNADTISDVADAVTDRDKI